MDHRRFSRILFSSDAKLLCKEQTFSTEVLDLSLKGALVKRPLQWDIAIGSKVILQF
ncbi:MAG: PilZ domain-containing protein, partial [Gammaproteobacteria bacterium]|nr:PilZ domain-containing protein [Gammaproteobacteria bacterium]